MRHAIPWPQWKKRPLPSSDSFLCWGHRLLPQERLPWLWKHGVVLAACVTDLSVDVNNPRGFLSDWTMYRSQCFKIMSHYLGIAAEVVPTFSSSTGNSLFYFCSMGQWPSYVVPNLIEQSELKRHTRKFHLKNCIKRGAFYGNRHGFNTSGCYNKIFH